jgi:hypothetical protein
VGRCDVGGNIKTPTKVKTSHPSIGRRICGRITGVVILEVTIDIDGRVSDAIDPPIDPAARQRCRSKRGARGNSRPTEINGMRVPVMQTVTVNFHLQ